MKQGWRRRRSRGTVGSLRPKHKAEEPPFTTPQSLTPCPLITHTGTKESTFHGFSHGAGRREGQARGRQRDGREEEERMEDWP